MNGGLTITTDVGAFSVTFSAGVCCIEGPLAVDLDSLIESAGRALYEAKTTGCDRIVSAKYAQVSA